MIKRVMFFLGVVFFISLASASFNVNQSSSNVETSYFSGEAIRGNVRMSFDNQENDYFAAKFDGNISGVNISLLDVFNAMGLTKGTNYNCSPFSCKNSYDAIDSLGNSETNFVLGEEEKVYGFKLVGDPIKGITQFKFNITSDAGPSCGNQILLDMFDDGSIDYYNTERNNIICPSTEEFDGCYNEDEWVNGEEAIIDGTGYCEFIELMPAAAGYSLEANVKKVALGEGDKLEMKIYNFDKGKEGWGCEINPQNIGGAGTYKNLYCFANYSVIQPFNAFVCIKQTGGRGEYRIKTESSTPCGGRLPGSLDSFIPSQDFEIKARPIQYASFGSALITVGSYKELNGNDMDLKLLVKDYIQEVYGSNCSEVSGGCFVPFGIRGVPQTVTLNNGLIQYEKGADSILTSVTNFYELEKSNFKINSNYTNLDISKMGFVVPNKEGEQNFELFFGNTRVANGTINVDVGFDFEVGPKFALVGQDTLFSVYPLGNDTLISTVWNFGDSASLVPSTTNQATHRYRNESEYILGVTATNQQGEQSTKQFKIVVGEAQASLNQTLIKYRRRVSDLKSDVEPLNPFVKDEITRAVNLSSIENSILSIQNRYGQLGSEATTSQYIGLINELLLLDVPYSIVVSESGTLPGEVGLNNAAVKHIQDISQDSGDQGAIKNAIVGWMSENYALNIKFEKYSALRDVGDKDILTSYKVGITSLSGGSEDAYMIINYPKTSILFDGNYFAEAVSGGSGTSIPIYGGESPEEIKFLIEGENAPSVESLGIYVSPEVSSLSLNGDIGKPVPVVREGFNWFRFIIGMFIVFVIILVIYVILQSWYKKYYEKHLFKNPDDLYNIINFIYNSRKNGMIDSEIRKSLSEKKWKGEQITYAFNKIDGKRTGLWEIPLFKFIENKKVRKELEKKQGGKIDARFIKRPSLY